MKGVELLGQLRHEAMVVVDHTQKALEAGLGVGDGELVDSINP